MMIQPLELLIVLRIAETNTSSTPCPCIAEHSMYLDAPTCLAASWPYENNMIQYQNQDNTKKLSFLLPAAVW